MSAAKYRQSRLWDYFGRIYTLRKFDNVVNPIVNRRYLNYGWQHAGPQWRRGTYDWPLRSSGPIRVAQGVAADAARAWSELISVEIEAVRSRQPKGLPNVHIIPDPIALFGDEVLKIFDGPIGVALRDLFGSEFRVEWLDCYRTFPGEERKSWRWHTDNVPPFVVKVLLYLTDVGKDSGPTHLLSPQKTKMLRDHGYFPMREENRPQDIERNGVVEIAPTDIFSVRAAAGDAILINTNHYHKAVPPLRGYRDVITALALPSKKPWSVHRDAQSLSELVQSGSFRVDPFTT